MVIGESLRTLIEAGVGADLATSWARDKRLARVRIGCCVVIFVLIQVFQW